MTLSPSCLRISVARVCDTTRRSRRTLRDDRTRLRVHAGVCRPGPQRRRRQPIGRRAARAALAGRGRAARPFRSVCRARRHRRPTAARQICGVPRCRSAAMPQTRSPRSSSCSRSASISSQVVDNLNASIHVRALLTDLFLIDEILKTPAADSATRPIRSCSHAADVVCVALIVLVCDVAANAQQPEPARKQAVADSRRPRRHRYRRPPRRADLAQRSVHLRFRSERA